MMLDKLPVVEEVRKKRQSTSNTLARVPATFKHMNYEGYDLLKDMICCNVSLR